MLDGLPIWFWYLVVIAGTAFLVVRHLPRVARRRKQQHAPAATIARPEEPPAMTRIEMPEILAWLQTRAPRSPDLWHILPDLNWDHEEHLHPILLWVVRQPDCDAATAIDILSLMNDDVTLDLASGGTRWARTGFDPNDSDEVRLLQAICERSEGGGFAGPVLKQTMWPSTHANHQHLEMLQGVLAKIEAEGRSVPFPLPVKLLSAPVPDDVRPARTPVRLDDDAILVPHDMV